MRRRSSRSSVGMPACRSSSFLDVAYLDELLASDAPYHMRPVLNGLAERLQLDLRHDLAARCDFDDAVDNVRIVCSGVAAEAKVDERVAIVQTRHGTDGGSEDVGIVPVFPHLARRHGGEVQLELETA